MKIKIRPMKESDVKVFLPLFKATVFSIPDYTPKLRQHFIYKYRASVVKKRIHDKAATPLGAFIGGQMVGFIWGQPMRRTVDGVYWMNWVGVDPKYRQQGVARALMINLERRLKNHHFHKIWFLIDPKNTRSQKFFKAMRYSLLVRIKKHWYKQDGLLWEKYLG